MPMFIHHSSLLNHPNQLSQFSHSSVSFQVEQVWRCLSARGARSIPSQRLPGASGFVWRGKEDVKMFCWGFTCDVLTRRLGVSFKLLTTRMNCGTDHLTLRVFFQCVMSCWGAMSYRWTRGLLRLAQLERLKALNVGTAWNLELRTGSCGTRRKHLKQAGLWRSRRHHMEGRRRRRASARRRSARRRWARKDERGGIGSWSTSKRVLQKVNMPDKRIARTTHYTKKVKAKSKTTHTPTHTTQTTPGPYERQIFDAPFWLRWICLRWAKNRPERIAFQIDTGNYLRQFVAPLVATTAATGA